MGSDRTRRSYDSSNGYRSVVMQQGRAFVEADWNEQQEILTEEMRLTTLDIVGPAGSIGDGYIVSVEDRDEFTIGPGTIYVGGLRMTLAKELPCPRETRDGDRADAALVYLEVIEQEISATEDRQLKDDALGGPDTAQRVLLMQRFGEHETNARTYHEASESLHKYWYSHGVDWDRKTMEFLSRGRLEVAFKGPDDDDDDFARSRVGIYRHDENQMIRVQITDHHKDRDRDRDSDKDRDERMPALIWGFDNASDLYRVALNRVDNGHASLRLKTKPVDQFHFPRRGQAVEILKTVGHLGNGEPIAASHGRIIIVDPDHRQPYDPDAETLQIAGHVPSDYEGSDTSPLFLRIWETYEEFTAGEPVKLGDTGLCVTLTLDGKEKGRFQVGDYWMIAVRPGIPSTIYPQRLLPAMPDETQLLTPRERALRSPDGPRKWICPLAHIDWSSDGDGKPHDCRPPAFKDLVTLTKECREELPSAEKCCCCSVHVTRRELTGEDSLLSIINSCDAGPITICLTDAEYILETPLRLTGGERAITFKGCRSGTTLRVKEGCDAAFRDGMIVLHDTERVTLENLTFKMPTFRFTKECTLAGLSAKQFFELCGYDITEMQASIGLRLVNAQRVTVDACTFEYPKGNNLFKAGILASGDCSKIKIYDCRFNHDVDMGEGIFDTSFGCAIVPSMSISSDDHGAITNGRVLGARLSSAELRGNRFRNLDAAAVIYADAGSVAVKDNTATDCYAGIWLLAAKTLHYFDAISNVDLRVETAPEHVNALQQHAERMQALLESVYRGPIVLRGVNLARIYPFPDKFVGETKDVNRPPDIAHTAEIQLLISKAMSSFVTTLRSAQNLLHKLVVSGPPQTHVSELEGYDRLMRDLAAIEREYHKERSSDSLQLQVEGNRIVSRKSGFGLLVWDNAQDENSTAAVNANIIRVSSKDSAAAIVGVNYAAISGNIILNSKPTDGDHQNSLAYLGGVSYGITGNALMWRLQQ